MADLPKRTERVKSIFDSDESDDENGQIGTVINTLDHSEKEVDKEADNNLVSVASEESPSGSQETTIINSSSENKPSSFSEDKRPTSPTATTLHSLRVEGEFLETSDNVVADGLGNGDTVTIERETIATDDGPVILEDGTDIDLVEDGTTDGNNFVSIGDITAAVDMGGDVICENSEVKNLMRKTSTYNSDSSVINLEENIATLDDRFDALLNQHVESSESSRSKLKDPENDPNISSLGIPLDSFRENPNESPVIIQSSFNEGTEHLVVTTDLTGVEVTDGDHDLQSIGQNEFGGGSPAGCLSTRSDDSYGVEFNIREVGLPHSSGHQIGMAITGSDKKSDLLDVEFDELDDRVTESFEGSVLATEVDLEVQVTYEETELSMSGETLDVPRYDASEIVESDRVGMETDYSEQNLGQSLDSESVHMGDQLSGETDDIEISMQDKKGKDGVQHGEEVVSPDLGHDNNTTSIELSQPSGNDVEAVHENTTVEDAEFDHSTKMALSTAFNPDKLESTPGLKTSLSEEEFKTTEDVAPIYSDSVYQKETPDMKTQPENEEIVRPVEEKMGEHFDAQSEQLEDYCSEKLACNLQREGSTGVNYETLSNHEETIKEVVKETLLKGNALKNNVAAADYDADLKAEEDDLEEPSNDIVSSISTGKKRHLDSTDDSHSETQAVKFSGSKKHKLDTSDGLILSQKDSSVCIDETSHIAHHSVFENVPEEKSTADAAKKSEERGRSKKHFSLPDLMVAFEKGWRRELVRGNADSTGPKRTDVYYYNQEGKKFRSNVQIREYLQENQITDLTMKNFSFHKYSFGAGEPYEIVRTASVASSRVEIDNGADGSASSQEANNVASESRLSNTDTVTLPRKMETRKRPNVNTFQAKNSKVSYTLLKPKKRPGQFRKTDQSHSGSQQKVAPNLAAARSLAAKLLAQKPKTKFETIQSSAPAQSMKRKDVGDVAVYATHLFPCNPPLMQQRIVTPKVSDKNKEKTFHCTSTCKKGGLNVPSMQCLKCFCLFHPECCEVPPQIVNIMQAALVKFLCPNCYKEASKNSNGCRATHHCYEPLAFDPIDSSEDEGMISDIEENSQDRRWQKAKELRPVGDSRFTPLQFIEFDPHCDVEVTERPKLRYVDNSKELEYQPNFGSPISIPSYPRVHTSGRMLGPSAAVTKMVQKAISSRTEQTGGFFTDMVQGYNIMCKVFKYLSIHDLLRVSVVCRFWRDLTRSPEMWKVVSLRNVRVKDWSAMIRFLNARNTRELDIRNIDIDTGSQAEAGAEVEHKENGVRDEAGIPTDGDAAPNKSEGSPMGEKERRRPGEDEEMMKEREKIETEGSQEKEAESLREEERRIEKETLEKEEKERREREEKERKERIEREEKERKELEEKEREKEEKERLKKLMEKEEMERQESLRKFLCETIYNEHDYFGRWHQETLSDRSSSDSDSLSDSDSETETESETETKEIIKKVKTFNTKPENESPISLHFSPKVDETAALHHMDIDALVREGETFLTSVDERSPGVQTTPKKVSDKKGNQGMAGEYAFTGSSSKRASVKSHVPSKGTSKSPSKARTAESGSTDKAEKKRLGKKDGGWMTKTDKNVNNASKEIDQQNKGTPAIVVTSQSVATVDPKKEGPYAPWHVVGSALGDLFTLEKLTMGPCEPEVVEILLSYCHNLKSINVVNMGEKKLSSGELMSFDPSYLMKTRNLEEIRLASHDEFVFKSNFNFIKLPKLKVLVIKGLHTSENGWPYLGVDLTRLEISSALTFNTKNWCNIGAMVNLVDLCLDVGGADHDTFLCNTIQKLPKLTSLALFDWPVGPKLPHTLKRLSNIKRFHIIPSAETEFYLGINTGRLMVIVETIKHFDLFIWGILPSTIVSDDNISEKVHMRPMKPGKESVVCEGEEMRSIPIEGIAKYVRMHWQNNKTTVFTVRKESHSPLSWVPWSY